VKFRFYIEPELYTIVAIAFNKRNSFRYKVTRIFIGCNANIPSVPPPNYSLTQEVPPAPDGSFPIEYEGWDINLSPDKNNYSYPVIIKGYEFYANENSPCKYGSAVVYVEEPYDILNGSCIPSSTYNTQGLYPSIIECLAEENIPSGDNVNFSTISAQIFTGNCDSNGNPVYDTQDVQIIQGIEDSELLKYEQLSKIQGYQICNIDVAACPDGWQIRPEYHRPQVIYQFAEINASGVITGAPKYKITVPHHVSTQPDEALPNYQRGNWEIIYVLSDNSKITIHSVDEPNGLTMLDAIKLRINPTYLNNAYLSKSSLVVTDTQIAQITVKNRMAKYYSTGTKSDLPDWIIKW